ncbi:MAG: hypothetical protein HYS98_01520, partial [Deltaproteobacteria bacterium]|nr:hypothetical protein [Deltaproteobacteria bacterium]
NIESLPSNKELLHEVVGERIQQQAPSFTPAAPKPNSAQTPALSNPAVEDLMPKVQELVDTAFQKGLQEAIDEALKTSDFALLDIFHSALVGQLYDDLVERKIIAEP